MPPLPLSVITDVHAHFLPAIDDGPATFDEAIEVLRVAHAGGTGRAVATPHLFHPGFERADADAARHAFEALRSEIERRKHRPESAFLSDLDLRLGGEHYLGSELLQAAEAAGEPDAGGRLLGLDGSRNLLVEFSPLLAPEAVVTGLSRLVDLGWRPVVAHLDRYPSLVAATARLERLLEIGCTLQVNGSCLSKPTPWRLRRRLRRLLGDGFVRVVASDGHDADRRSMDLSAARRVLARLFGQERARAWLETGPASLLGPAS